MLKDAIDGRGATLYLELLKAALSGSLYDESSWEVLERSRSSRERRLWPLGRYLRGVIRSAAVSLFGRANIALVIKHPYDTAKREEGVDWPLVGYSMIGRQRLDNLQSAVETVLREGIPGDLAETGVWRGGASMLMKAVLDANGCKDRNVWLADSFAGLPPPTAKHDGWDVSHVEYLAVSIEQVKSNFQRFGLLDDQVRFLPGWFSETLPTAPIERLAILRLDGDLYSSTMDALTNLYPKVVEGGFVIIDDYGTWPACRQAVHDYIAAHAIDARLEKIDDAGVYWRVAAPAAR